MTRDEWMKAFNKLPAAAQGYLLETQSGVNEDTAQTALGYDTDAWDRVMDVVWDLLFTKLNFQEFQSRVKIVAGDRKPQDVERELLRNVILPLGDLLLWDVDARLQELGVPSTQTQSIPRVSLRPLSYGAAARRIASNAKLSILSEESVRRLREILISYLKGVRTQEQVIEILTRSQTDGGMGFARTQADTLFQSMVDFLGTTQVMSEEEYARWYQEYQQKAEAGETDEEKEEAETAAATGEEEAVMVPKFATTGSLVLDQALERSLAEIGDIGKDGYLLKRVRNTISTRLRDVRNAIQLKEILSRDEKVGGVGLAADQVERIAGIVERIYTETRDSIATEEKSRIQTTMDEQKKMIVERRQRESEEHAQWYKDKVVAARPEEVAKQLLASMQAQAASGQVQAKPTSMDGVVPPVRLTGLAEELGGMTIDGFRRLSKDPDQSAKQIVRKLETLKQESFERWTEGVEAWRRSPLQQQYLKLVTESFRDAKPVAQLAEERRRTEPGAPSAAELGAIIWMNTQIQL